MQARIDRAHTYSSLILETDGELLMNPGTSMALLEIHIYYNFPVWDFLMPSHRYPVVGRPEEESHILTH